MLNKCLCNNMQTISHLSKSETRVHLLYPNIIITVEIYLVNSNTRFKKSPWCKNLYFSQQQTYKN